MSNVYVKPMPGQIVRDPVSGQVLSPAGGYKPRSPYWLRRLRDADVVECNPPARPAPAKASPAKAPAAGSARKS